MTAVDRGRSSAAEVSGVGEGAAGTLHTLEIIERGSRFWFEVIVHSGFGDAVGSYKPHGCGQIVVEECVE